MLAVDLCALLYGPPTRRTRSRIRSGSCKARIDQEGWTLTTSYTDHAVSGSIRVASRLPEAARRCAIGSFEVVVAEALDRLSRDQEDVAALYKHLHFRA